LTQAVIVQDALDVQFGDVSTLRVRRRRVRERGAVDEFDGFLLSLRVDALLICVV
jgi:hypothetical protein